MHYITLTKIESSVRLTLLPEGRNELRARQDAGRSIETDSTLNDLLGNYLNEGWDRVRPDEISGPGSAPMISDECHRFPDGRIELIGLVYWHERYLIESAVVELLRVGHVDFAEGYWPKY